MVRLRDGQVAGLHLIEIGASELTTVAVLVPSPGSTIAVTPPPTAVVASSRIGEVRCDAFGMIVSASASTPDAAGAARRADRRHPGRRHAPPRRS
jgi:hypothetical protein